VPEQLLSSPKQVKVLGRNSDKGKAYYPADHKPGMAVPKGGSNCANCEYLKDADKKLCGEENFVRWNGSATIPGEIDSYCSDWYSPAENSDD
jgi:hypothetical protein